MITPIILNHLQWKAYLIFTATNLLFIPIIYFFFPETSNLELEEVDYIFARGGNPVAVAREMQKELATHGHLDAERRASVRRMSSVAVPRRSSEKPDAPEHVA